MQYFITCFNSAAYLNAASLFYANYAHYRIFSKYFGFCEHICIFAWFMKCTLS